MRGDPLMEAAEIIQETPAQRDTARGLEFVLLSLACMVALADFCLWRESPGLSVGLLAAGAAGIILINRPGMRWTRSAVFIVALLCGAAVESAIDLCFSNGLVLLVLLLALAGETYYGTLQSGWSRWSEQIWTMVKTPGRWIWLLLEVGIQSRKIGPMPPGALKKVARVLWIVVPGVVMTLLFAAILYNGNALFANLTGYWATAVADWIARLHLSFWRCVFWGFVAWVALPLLRPSPAPTRPRPWTMEIPRLPEMTTARTARMQSAVMLGLLNALFCCVNTIDVVYLWARQKLPAGVSYSAFVHEGVAALILAALFSAVLLAGLFQQARTVSEWRPLRLLGLLWIGQNLMLLAGVVLRVKLYVDAFDLTVTRVNLVFFLALVAVGFVLLAVHVWRQHTLGWLLLANMLAAFFLFYAIQFLDTDGFVARYNVNLWLNAHDGRRLDVDYLKRLGPAAFESIEKVAQSGKPEAAQAADYLKTARSQAQYQLTQRKWPSCQLRAMRSCRKLLMTTQP
jgi:hypothetical protein